MGIFVWLLGGLAAWGVARLIPRRRSRSWRGELLMALTAAFLLGAGATALDFGGWREPDWRAGLFAFSGSFAILGLIRAVRDPSAPARPVRTPPRA